MIFAVPLLAFGVALAQDLSPAEQADPCNHGVRYYWDARFEPGQRWSYHSRFIDAGSVITIAEVDNMPEVGEVVHILVDHIHSRTPDGRVFSNGGTQHFAIKRDSLDASVVALIDSGPIPDVSSGYLNWHLHCAALTYATTVADTLNTIDLVECERLAKLVAKRSNGSPAPCKTMASDSPTRSPSPQGPPLTAPASTHGDPPPSFPKSPPGS